MELANHISDEEMSRFSGLRDKLTDSATGSYVRNLIRRSRVEDVLEFLESLEDRSPSEEQLTKLGLYSQRKTRLGSIPLETQFQNDVRRLQCSLDEHILFEIETNPKLARESGITEIDHAIVGFLNSLSGDGFEGLSTKDKITRCFSLCNKSYKQARTIPPRFQPLVNLLKKHMESAFIKDHSRTNSTLTIDHKGQQYLRKSGLHEFVKVKHRVENFLMSIGQHPIKTAWKDYIPYIEASKTGYHKKHHLMIYMTICRSIQQV